MKQRDKKPVTTVTNDKDSATLFRDAMRGVSPLAHSNKATPTHKQTPPIPRQTQLDEQSCTNDSLSDHITWEIKPGDEWSFQRPGISRQIMRRLRRSHWGIQAYLDLHGFTRDEARQELVTFLNTCNDRNFRSVRVIHGKGLGSKNHVPVLKASIGNWLVQRDDVLAFCQAKPEDGGSGAMLILLKTSSGNQKTEI